MNLDYSMEHSPLTQVNHDQYKKVLYGMYCLWNTSGQICKEWYQNPEELADHISEKPFLCPVEGCQRWFSSSSVRRHHARTHSEEKPYECKQCDKKYTHPCSLKNHIKAKHKEKPSGNSGPVGENPAPEHHNLTNTLSYSQVAYSGLDDHRYQIDCYPYDNYDSSVCHGHQNSINHSHQEVPGPYDILPYPYDSSM
ncbi:unnamed protein product [Caenorhabditis brenneri]